MKTEGVWREKKEEGGRGRERPGIALGTGGPLNLGPSRGSPFEGASGKHFGHRVGKYFSGGLRKQIALDLSTAVRLAAAKPPPTA